MTRLMVFGVCVLLGAASSTAEATLLNIDIVPTSSTTVAPGGSVTYDLIGVLSGEPTLGLGLFGVDLRSSWSIPGSLPRLLPGPEMYSFVRPQGLTNPPGPEDDDPLNPSGYGGTPLGDDWLAQIGGGQNTIGNTPPPDFPIGDVVLGIADNPVQLAFGVAHLPTTPGVYSLDLSEGLATVITGLGPPYPVESVTAVVFPTPSLMITVVPEPGMICVVGVGGLMLSKRRQLVSR